MLTKAMSNKLEILNCIFFLEVGCLNKFIFTIFFLYNFVQSFNIFSSFSIMAFLILFKIRSDALPYNIT